MDEINNNNVQNSPSPAPSSTASIVLGIISIVLSCFSTFVFPAILGVILSIIGCVSGNNCKKQGGTSAGLILSILGLIFNGAGFVLCVLCVGGTAALGAMM